MYKEVARNIPDVSIYPMISLGIFFLFFVGLLIWVFTADAARIKKIKNLPMDSENNSEL